MYIFIDIRLAYLSLQLAQKQYTKHMEYAFAVQLDAIVDVFTFYNRFIMRY